MSARGASVEQSMKIKAIAPWYGSKRTLAPRIVAELGSHRAYWEPFCGSMAVLLAKHESSHETVNDLHGDLINLARTIQDPHRGSALYRRLRRVLATEDAIERACALYDSSDNADDRAFAYFVMSWLGRNGFSGTAGISRAVECADESYARGLAVRWTPGGGHGGLRFQSAVESIAAWRRRMRRVLILQRDAFEIIGSIDDTEGVAIYCDPPYIEKDEEYLYDFDNSLFGNDHERLRDSLERFEKARVVVSYYAHQDISVLYRGWTIVDCAITKNLGARKAQSKKAPEVLILNGSSYTEAMS